MDACRYETWPSPRVVCVVFVQLLYFENHKLNTQIGWKHTKNVLLCKEQALLMHNHMQIKDLHMHTCTF